MEAFYDLAELCMIMEHCHKATGRTTSLVEAVKKIDGSLMVHSFEFGKQLQKTHGGLKILTPNNIIRESSKPILIDHYCIFKMAVEMKKQYEKQILDLKMKGR